MKILESKLLRFKLGHKRITNNSQCIWVIYSSSIVLTRDQRILKECLNSPRGNGVKLSIGNEHHHFWLIWQQLHGAFRKKWWWRHKYVLISLRWQRLSISRRLNEKTCRDACTVRNWNQSGTINSAVKSALNAVLIYCCSTICKTLSNILCSVNVTSIIRLMFS